MRAATPAPGTWHRALRRLLLGLIAMASIAGCQSLVPVRETASHDMAIQQVLASFQTALRTRDKPLYMSLFFSEKPEDIGWQHVSEDTRLAHIRQTKPDAVKARKLHTNHFIALIDEAVAAADSREERFTNVQVQTDGEIASVVFDYEFLAGGQATNWGKEMWQLVRTEAGWKIFSVIYTVRDRWSTPGTPPRP